MAKVVVEYNLDSPEDRSGYDLSSNAWRYKRILNKAVTLLGENSSSKDCKNILLELRLASQEIGLTEISERADSVLRPGDVLVSK